MKYERQTLEIENIVKKWVSTIVVELQLCPFAQHELISNRIRFQVSHARDESSLIEDLSKELIGLRDEKTIETSLLIHPWALQNFYTYNDFLSKANELLNQLGLEGVLQIASFHPDYQFAGTNKNDVENYTNRSPYPLMHILREESLELAISNYPDTELIPVNNIKKMESLGLDHMKKLLAECMRDR